MSTECIYGSNNYEYGIHKQTETVHLFKLRGPIKNNAQQTEGYPYQVRWQGILKFEARTEAEAVRFFASYIKFVYGESDPEFLTRYLSKHPELKDLEPVEIAHK